MRLNRHRLRERKNRKGEEVQRKKETSYRKEKGTKKEREEGRQIGMTKERK